MHALGRKDAATLGENTAAFVSSCAVSRFRTTRCRAAKSRTAKSRTADRHGVSAVLAMLAAFLVLATFNVPVAQASDPFCTGCHTVDRDGVPHHPTEGLVEGRTAATPRDLPLTDGQITCRTCHRGHGPDNQPDPGRFNLRLSPPDLCAQCHRSESGQWDRPHARYGDTLHGGTRLADTTVPGPDPGASDPISARCTACHGGNDPEFAGAPVHQGSSHPLSYYAGRDGMRRVDDLPPSIRLIDDRMACVSCHSTYAKTRLLMAMPGRKSDTCTACHDFGPRAADSERQQEKEDPGIFGAR